MQVMAHPFKVMLDQTAAKELLKVAIELQEQESNYQLGVASVAARILESIASHPDLIEKLLAEYAERKADESPRAAAELPAPPLIEKNPRKRFETTKKVSTSRR